MPSDLTIAQTGLDTWVTLDEGPADPAVIDRCRLEYLRSALGHLPGLEVVSVTVDTSGKFQAPKPTWETPPGMVLPDPPVFTGLPDFCDVRLRQSTPGGHVAEVIVWVPLRWNERFLGTGGAGNRTEPMWFMFPHDRVLLIPVALRNGFATATTDAGIRDPRLVDWAFTPGTGKPDAELIRNWVHRSTHDMTVAGKAVTEAIHGIAPRYSYFQGCSGGGRQAMMQAQRYPGDYDGIWSASPAINWTKFLPATVWPALVMKEHHNPLAPAKLEAFRAAAVAALDGVDGLRDGIIGAFDPRDFDAAQVVGTPTPAGPVTEADAEVMRKIWEGPTRADGESLWYGLRPGTESWGDNFYQHGLCLTAEADGELAPVPFTIGMAWLRLVAGDPELNLSGITFERFTELFDRSVRDFPEVAADDPDLSGLRDRAGKLILSHGSADEVIFVDGSVDYYQRVVEAMGGLDETTSFARLFVTEGDVHSSCIGRGPGLSIGAGMAALMNWVENGIAPDSITAERFDLEAGRVAATRPAYAYPFVPRYRGNGDPDDAASFVPGKA